MYDGVSMSMIHEERGEVQRENAYKNSGDNTHVTDNQYQDT